MGKHNFSRFGVAVVGTGFGQAIHIPGFQHHPLTEVVAVYHRDLAKGQAIAADHQIPQADDQLEKILARPEVQGVSLSTPPFLHYDMAKKILQAGKHLLLEKPMTLKAAETRELYHLAQTHHLTAIADFEFRTVPAWRLLAEYLQQDYVGKIRFIKVDWLVTSRANPERSWNWYARADQGGGVLGAIGSHVFDYLHWLFGPIHKLCGQLSCAIVERPDPQDNNRLKPVTADDTCLILL
jgi:predicted dehydrogenase